jgi:hypothetical protein
LRKSLSRIASFIKSFDLKLKKRHINNLNLKTILSLTLILSLTYFNGIIVFMWRYCSIGDLPEGFSHKVGAYVGHINIKLRNISNPTMRTGLDFKSAQFDQNTVRIGGFEITSSKSLLKVRWILIQSKDWINFDPVNRLYHAGIQFYHASKNQAIWLANLLLNY